MKITKSRLKQIIKEELTSLYEDDVPYSEIEELMPGAMDLDDDGWSGARGRSRPGTWDNPIKGDDIEISAEPPGGGRIEMGDPAEMEFSYEEEGATSEKLDAFEELLHDLYKLAPDELRAMLASFKG